MIKVVPKIILLLELFADGSEHTFAQILSCSGLTRSNASHLLESLCSERVLAKRGRGVYVRGERLLHLGGQDNFAELRRIARSCCIMTRDALNELAVVGIRRGTCRITVAKIQPERNLQVNEDTGKQYPSDWYGTANGRVLLACAPQKAAAEVVRKCGLPDPHIWKGVSSLPKLERELAKIREQGFAVMTLADEVKMFALPVRDCAGENLLALSCAVPLFRQKMADEEIIEKLRYCAERLENELKAAGVRIDELNEIPLNNKEKIKCQN